MSEELRRVLGDTPGKDSFLFLLTSNYEVVAALIKFMYTGETEVSQILLPMFLKLSEELKIKGLIEEMKNQTELSFANKRVVLM